MRAGQHIRRHRQRIGLTQRELARMLGVSHATVGAYEAGTSIPGRRRVHEIVVVLGLSLAEWDALERAAQIDEIDAQAA